MSQNTGYLKGGMWSYDWGGSHGGLPGAGNALFLDLGGSYPSIGFVIICQIVRMCLMNFLYKCYI